MSHGAQCVCQICTCGRHACPHDRNASSLALGDAPSEYRRKEYAVVTGSEERPERYRPRSQLGIGSGIPNIEIARTETSEAFGRPASSGGHRTGEAESKALAAASSEQSLTTNTRNRFVTSAALKKRQMASQIQIGDGAGAESPFARPTVASSMRAADNSGIVRMARGTARPPTSDIWKNGGGEAMITETSDQFKKKTTDRAARSTNLRGKTQMEFNQSTDMTTQSMKDYANHGKGERFDAVKRDESDHWKTNGSNMRGTTSVSQADFGKKKGERYNPVKPRDSNLLKGDGAFTGETQNANDFRNTKGDRYDPVKPNASEIWKNDARMDGDSVNRTDYAAKKGERYDAVKPRDSNLLKGDGAFTGETQNANDFRNTKGDRYDPVKPNASEIWKNDARMDGDSVNRTDYAAKKGERYDPVKPRDSNLLKGDGAFTGETISRSEFSAKQGDRFESKKYGSSDIWKSDARFVDGTVNRSDYGAFGPGERARPVVRSAQGVIYRDDSGLNNVSQSAADFQWRGELTLPQIRNARSNNDLSTSQILIGNDEDWHGSSMYSDTFRIRDGQRVKMVRPTSSLKVGGERTMEHGYEKEFAYRPVHCLAGELIDSIQKNQVDTDHYHYKEKKGQHHFFHPR